ncbi:MAG TPA: hypothetical protein VKC15_04450 [Gemmatimonadales bacterium]|nr:hypothetical protein [Gemmatimonadales bacterium]
MTLTTLLAVATLSQSPAQTLVDIHDLTPREHRTAGFVLAAPQELRVAAVGADPRPERAVRDRDKDSWQDDDRTTWPAAAWIIDTRTREVVWDLRAAATERSSSGLRRFAGTVRLPAGVYEAHYASYAAAWTSIDGTSVIDGLRRLAGRIRYGGPYVDDGSYKEFSLTIAGAGRAAPESEVEDASRAFTASAIARLAPEPSATARYGFALARPTDVEVYAIGEIRRDGAFDYGWITNADTRACVWKMDYANSEPAGGATKNRMVRQTLHLPAGRYVAYFVTDDSHDPDEWNAVPALDPDFWGLTLRVADATARAGVRPFAYEPVPAGQTLASLVGIGDDASPSAGFTLRRPMDVRVYAIGEGVNDEMVDYAWIVDATHHARVWTMRYEDTEPAGGAEKNRLFDGTVHLDAGSYLVRYTSDGSHSAADWNAAPPAEERYWGVSVFPASGRVDSAVVGKFERGPNGTVLAELVRMGDDERAHMPFRLERETTLRVYALGEGVGGDMADYGWIEDAASGRVVWEMSYDATEPAGGARKNRAFEGTIRLPAGSYVLHYKSDGSHSYEHWNNDAPDDAESWGITVFRLP